MANHGVGVPVPPCRVFSFHDEPQKSILFTAYTDIKRRQIESSKLKVLCADTLGMKVYYMAKSDLD